jgi:prepilin-type N-terminal cleavage/methylation domain-containing protein
MGDDMRTLMRDERGLTLAEILVAVAIIGLGLAGLAVVIPVSSYGVQEGNQLSTATFLAEQMIERARAAAWTGSPAVDCLGLSANLTTAPAPSPAGTTCNGSSATTFPDETTAGTGVSGYTQYTRFVRITACDATSPCGGVNNTSLRRVGVTVSYRPISASGGSVTPKTVYVEWLVSQK